jgi:hypothetical protein
MKNEAEFYANGQATLLYNDSTIKIVIPHTKEASIFFGRNTNWLTAITESENIFEQYTCDLYYSFY